MRWLTSQRQCRVHYHHAFDNMVCNSCLSNNTVVPLVFQFLKFVLSLYQKIMGWSEKAGLASRERDNSWLCRMLMLRSASEFSFSFVFSSDFDVQRDFNVQKQAGHWDYQVKIFLRKKLKLDSLINIQMLVDSNPNTCSTCLTKASATISLISKFRCYGVMAYVHAGDVSSVHAWPMLAVTQCLCTNSVGNAKATFLNLEADIFISV